MGAAEPTSTIDYVLALRPHQWAKNLLVFVPLVLTPSLVVEPALQLAALATFAAFSLCASAGYVVNDLIDLEADRAHPTKCRRPFARGALSVRAGLWLAVALVVAAFSLAWATSPASVRALLALYLISSLVYSLWLKRLMFLDVLVLAGLYTLRLLAGAAATDIVPTPWLLAFALFLFTSLALVKRYSELQLMAAHGVSEAAGRGYRVESAAQVAQLGASCAGLSILVLCLYINSAEVERLYPNGALLWLLFPTLLYWIGRIWLLARAGKLPGDPVAFAVRDPASLVTGLLTAAVLAAAAKL